MSIVVVIFCRIFCVGAHIFHCGMLSSGNLSGIVGCCGISSGTTRKYVNIWGKGSYPLKLLRMYKTISPMYVCT